jgi:hypothetical protein
LMIETSQCNTETLHFLDDRRGEMRLPELSVSAAARGRGASQGQTRVLPFRNPRVLE